MRIGILGKIIILIGAILVLGMGTNALINIIQFEKNYRHALQTKVMTVGRHFLGKLQKTLSLGFPLEKLPGVNEECKRIVEAHEEISDCSVVNSSMKVIYAGNASFLGSTMTPPIMDKQRITTRRISLAGKQFYEINVPIPGETKALGLIRLTVPVRFIKSKTERMMLSSVLCLIASFAAALLAAFFFARGITQPLTVLAAGAKRISSGRYGHGLEVRSRDEVGDLAEAFSQMAVVLEQREEALRASEETFRTISSSAQDAIIMMDNDGIISYWNEAAERIFEYTKEEALGKDMHNLLGPERYDKAYQEGFKKFRNTGRGPVVGNTVELSAVRKDGTEFPVEVSVAAVKIKGKWNAIGTLRDITERRRAEEALRESEEKYRSLFEETTDAILIVRPEGEIVDANPSCSELFGATKEELIGTDVRQFYWNPADRENISRQIDQNGFVKEADWRVRRKDGAMRTCLITSSAWRDEHDNLLAYLSIARDITERKKAEEERVRLVTAIEQSPETILITDTDGIIQYVNPAFETVTGYTRHEALGRNPRILKSGQHDEGFYREMWESIKRGRVWSGHFINKKKDGTIFEEEATISPVKDEAGRIVNYVAVKRDVTGEVLLEKQLQLAQKMEAIGTLAGGIAHDFNNLLQVIQGYVDLGLIKLRKGRPGPSEYQEIRRAARSAAELTQGLLTFSRQLGSELRPVNLNHELEHVARMLTRTIPRMISIKLDLADDLHTINADPAHLQQVVINLAVNARDAMPDGGTLLIETRNAQLDAEYCKSHLGTNPGRYVLLAVSDNGFGMEKETAEQIFEPFFTTKRPGEGTGLGLSIVYGIVKNHAGNIICYTEPGEGTTFKVYLPTMESEVDTTESADVDTLPRGLETILLVDDEEAVRNSGESILTFFGYSVLTAANGREGLEVYRRKRHEISLVILDLIMPEMSGGDCLLEILRIDPDAKVIIASGYTANGQINQALQEMAKAFLRKPYEAHDVLQLVREVLDEKLPERA